MRRVSNSPLKFLASLPQKIRMSVAQPKDRIDKIFALKSRTSGTP